MASQLLRLLFENFAEEHRILIKALLVNMRQQLKQHHIRVRFEKPPDGGEERLRSPLTVEDARFYIANRGQNCPFCDAPDVEPGGEGLYQEEGSPLVRQRLSCCQCAKRWVEVYRLAGVEEYRPPGGSSK